MVTVAEVDTSLTFKQGRNFIKGHHVAGAFNLGRDKTFDKNQFEQHRRELWLRLKKDGIIMDYRGGKL